MRRTSSLLFEGKGESQEAENRRKVGGGGGGGPN